MTIINEALLELEKFNEDSDGGVFTKFGEPGHESYHDGYIILRILGENDQVGMRKRETSQEQFNRLKSLGFQATEEQLVPGMNIVKYSASPNNIEKLKNNPKCYALAQEYKKLEHDRSMEQFRKEMEKGNQMISEFNSKLENEKKS